MIDMNKIKELHEKWEVTVKNVNPDDHINDLRTLDDLAKETLEIILIDDDLKLVAELTINLFALRLFNGMTDTDINNWTKSESEWWTDPEKVQIRIDNIEKSRKEQIHD